MAKASARQHRAPERSNLRRRDTPSNVHATSAMNAHRPGPGIGLADASSRTLPRGSSGPRHDRRSSGTSSVMHGSRACDKIVRQHGRWRSDQARHQGTGRKPFEANWAVITGQKPKVHPRQDLRWRPSSCARACRSDAMVHPARPPACGSSWTAWSTISLPACPRLPRNQRPQGLRRAWFNYSMGDQATSLIFVEIDFKAL